MIRMVGAILIVCVSGALQGLAQDPQQPSLSERLLAEDPITLARDARERGDSVHGAILFAQKSLNCTTCHAQGASDLLGPDLTRVGDAMKDVHFVESILHPSKVISKGFESVKILTSDGQVIAGRIIRQNDRQIELREVSDKNRSITVEKTDVQRIQMDTVSAMPEKLADQLADRQQFLDLVKYIMDIAQTGPMIDAAGLSKRGDVDVDERLKGMALIDRFGCANCHTNESSDGLALALFPRKQGPDLAEATRRIDPQYIQRFIADPHRSKPGTSMPNVMGHLSPGERTATSTAITHYLMSLQPKAFGRQRVDLAAASRGRDTFHSVGCVACHSPRDDQSSELMADQSVALGEISDKYSIDGLSTFLEKPHLVRPSGRMPDMGLSHWEAIDVANYLLQNAAQENGTADKTSAIRIDREKVSAGRRHFSQLGCVQCHKSAEVETQSLTNQTTVGSEQSERSYPRFSDRALARGCLSDQSGSWPKYELTRSQRDAIVSAIEQSRDPLSDQQQIVLTMETFRCFACHRRDELGGVTDDRDPFFHTTNQNLGPQGRIPPTLTGVGGKLRPKWLREVLVSGRAIRPYMKTRMPQYGAKNVAHLVDLFGNVDPKPIVDFAATGDPKETRKIGTELVGSAGLNCIACHTFQQKPSQTMPAVDLTEMAERLQKEWFHQYMLSPQSLSPGTVMPSFWPGGKAIRKEILDGDTNRQIGAVWEYLLDGRQARTPRGLRSEPMELLATDNRAVMLRRSYRDIGKRGIGVGFSGGVNLAYDAEQMRLALIWKGRFADPGGVWRGQGHGSVRPLGQDLIRFEAGPDVDDIQSPWAIDEGRPPKHRFTGYSLDDHGRPAFTYRFDDVEIQDHCIDVIDEPSDQTILKRTLTLTAREPHPHLAFRVADGQQVTKIDEQTYRVGDSLRIRIDQPHQAKIVAREAGQRLIIPLSLPAGSTELVLHYSW